MPSLGGYAERQLIMRNKFLIGALAVLLWLMAGCGIEGEDTGGNPLPLPPQSSEVLMEEPAPPVESQPSARIAEETVNTELTTAEEIDEYAGVAPDPLDTFLLHMTRDLGEELLETLTVGIKPGHSLMDYMQEEWQVKTGFGGGFVKGINGLESASISGGRFDWFFYVNNEVSPVGAEQYEPKAGDIIYWDYHQWSAAGNMEDPERFPPVKDREALE